MNKFNRTKLFQRILPAALLLIPAGSPAMQPDTIWNQTDTWGRKQGHWKKISAGGELVYRGFFRDDRPVGKMQRFYEDGSLQADLYYPEGTGETYTTVYYRNGKPAAKGKYRNREKDSVWLYFSYYSSSLSYKETYLNGKKNGKSAKFYPEGSVSEILYWKDDLKHGKWQQFYEDSTLRLSATYHEGKLDGEYRVWNREKVILLRGKYLGGKMHGTWIFNDSMGNRLKELEYDRGKIRNREALEKWVDQYMDEVEKKLGEIPEVDFDNFFNRE